ncbi:MAG: T9SS type A sorting domain-containing protein [Ignavibacteriaceae bacterium]|nr:T9SS type A sorting domain-containing protein [Ignavibacteriaceae bacterium]
MKLKQVTCLFVMLLSCVFFSSITFADTLYVSSGGDIQTAVNAASNGDLILVTDGTYSLTTPISISKSVTLRSQNGASVTTIDGGGSVVCMFMTNVGAVVDGFTIKNGSNPGGYGGGVRCDNGTVQNCIIENNYSRDGGGVALNNSGLVLNCIIRNNTADWGGGVRCFNGTVRGCLITGNTATPHGGGINIWSGGTVQNCTITNNTATDGAGIRLWNNGIVENSIIYSNSGSANYIIDAGHGNSVTYSCTTPLYPGAGNTDAVPGFVNEGLFDYHLTPASALLNVGLNAGWMNTAFDLDGNSRILDATVDMGAYEYKSVTIGGPIPIASWPVNNATMYTNPPTLNWYMGVSATGLTYQIQCVPASDPAWPADNVYFLSASMSFTLPNGLIGGVKYAWRVRSTNGLEVSEWSTPELFTMVASASAGPVVPIASWPVDNATLYINPPTLNWYLGTSAIGLTYEVQCVPSSDPVWPNDNVFFPSPTLSYALNSNLSGGVQYAWRVRSTNGLTKSNWSIPELFTMAANTSGGPVTPIASWPVNNPTMYTNPPTLNWYLGTNAVGLSYEVQCVPASDPAWPADNVFSPAPTMSLTLNSALIGGVKYAWRVRSTDGLTKSNWSVPALFTMVANAAGAPVVPIASWPVNNPTLYSNTPKLSWYLGTSMVGLSYEIQCVPASDPAWPADNVFATSAVLSYTVPNALSGGVQYAWRVRSVLGIEKSNWSTPALFTIKASTAQSPAIPTASWPSGNHTIYSNPVTLSWYLHTSYAGLTYELQCVPASDPAWPADNVFATSAVLSYTMPVSLSGGVQYAWRVRSVLGAAKSDWSIPVLFTMVAGAAPVQPIPGSPTNNVTVGTSSPELFWYLPTAATSQHYELSYSASSDMSNAVTVGNINSMTYQLDNLNNGTTYYWAVRAIKSDGSSSIVSQRGAFKINTITGVDETKKNSVPDIFSLSQNYPNPFNPVTTITYSLPFDSKVMITVYNILGQEVSLLRNEVISAGNYEVQFNASNLSSGLYFYSIQANPIDGNKNFIEVKKMILMK